MFKIKSNTFFKLSVVPVLAIYLCCNVLNIFILGGFRTMLNDNHETKVVSIGSSYVDINSGAGKTLIRIDRSIVNNNTSMFKRIEFVVLFIFTGMALLTQKVNLVARQIALPATRQHTFLALRCIRI